VKINFKSLDRLVFGAEVHLFDAD